MYSLLIAFVACIPAIAPGPTAAPTAPPTVSTRTTGSPAVALLAFGSTWDAPGFEGEAAVLATAMAASSEGLRIDVARDATWLTAADGCPANLDAALRSPDLSDDAVARAAIQVGQELDSASSSATWLGAQALQMQLFRGLPEAHAPLGRRGSLPLIDGPRVRDRYRAWVSQATVNVSATPECAAQVAPAVNDALAHLPPAVVEPPPPFAATTPMPAPLHLAAPAPGLWVGWALPPTALPDRLPQPPAPWRAELHLGVKRPWLGLVRDDDLPDEVLDDELKALAPWLGELGASVNAEHSVLVHLHAEDSLTTGVSPVITTALEVLR